MDNLKKSTQLYTYSRWSYVHKLKKIHFGYIIYTALQSQKAVTAYI